MNKSTAANSVFENVTSTPCSTGKTDLAIRFNRLQESVSDCFKKITVITICISNHIILIILTLYF